MTNKKVRTVNIRVLKKDWELLKRLAKVNDRTLQSMFGIAVNIAGKMRA